MGRSTMVTTLALALFVFSQSPARTQRAEKAIRHARSLLADTCKLHSLLEASDDVFTLRSACRLGCSAEELIEKLACPSKRDQVRILVDACILMYKRT